MRRISASCWASFCPKKATSGAGEVQQLGDDGEHAVEVAGADGAFEALAHGARGDADLRLAARVDLVDGRGEDDVRAGLLGELEVGVQGARVAVEVLARRRTGAG